MTSGSLRVGAAARRLLALAAALPPLAAASARAFDRLAVASGWAPAGRVADSEEIEVSFWVKETNLDKLKNITDSVSDPQSPNYGHYLSKKEVDALTAPREADIAAVQKALLPYTGERAGDEAVITARVPAQFATGLLGGEFTYYCRGGTGGQDCVVRNPTARVPPALAAACDIVTPLDDPLPRRLPGPIVGPPMLAAEPGAESGGDDPEPALEVAAGAGCCFSIGYGAMMKPCCLSAYEVGEESACASGHLMGGARGFSEGACPTTAEEAARWLRTGEDAAPHGQDAATDPAAAQLRGDAAAAAAAPGGGGGGGPSAAALPLLGLLLGGAVLGALLYRQRQGPRQIPLLRPAAE